MGKILRLPELCKIVSMGKSTVWDMIRRGDFPRPIPLGDRVRGWDSDEVEKWIAERAAMREPDEPPATQEPMSEIVANWEQQLDMLGPFAPLEELEVLLRFAPPGAPSADALRFYVLGANSKKP